MENQLMVTGQSNVINYNSPEIVKTLMATVAVGLNPTEFQLFVQHCKGTGLNPFKREVWAVKTKGYKNRMGEFVDGKVQIMTGINGFHTIANNNPNYDGIEVGLVDAEGDFKSQAYPKSDFIGAWCRVYRKDRKMPVEAVAMLDEYDKSRTEGHYPERGIWRTMKRVMIQKCAESVALRKAFPQELNGLYTQEEMPAEYQTPTPYSSVAVDREAVDASLRKVSPDVVTEEPKAPPKKSGPKYAKQPAQEGVSGFEGYKYRYHLPYEKKGVDMNALRKELREKHGFKFNQNDKCWYSNEVVESVREYLRDAPTESHEAGRAEGAPIGIPEFDNDPMPEWDENDIPF